MKIQHLRHPTLAPALLLMLGLAVALPAAAAQGYHLWYDESGQAVYSQFPPEDGRPSETVKPPPPPAEAPEVAKQRLQERMQLLEDSREDKALSEEKAAEAEAKAARARQRCESARRNLEVLNGPPRQLYQTPDGSVVRMDEEERQRQRAEMQKVIAEDCR